MNSEYNYERTVDLGSFLKTVLKSWRQMLILGFVCALILGIIPVYEYKKEVSKNSSQTTSSNSANNDKYISSEEYRSVLKDLEQKLISKRQYLVNSILMKIDPFNEVRARKNLYFEQVEVTVKSTSDTETAGTVSRVMNDYEFFIKNRIDWTELSEKLGTEGKYLDECINLSTSVEKAKMVISVKHYDKDTAVEILDYIVEKVMEERSSVVEHFCNHNIVVRDGGVRIIYDSNIKNYQENFISELSRTKVRYNNFISARSDYVYNAPSSKKLDKAAVIQSLFIGFIGGCLIVFAISAIMIFAGGKVISAKELTLSYNLRSLINSPLKEKKKIAGFVDDWIENIGLGRDKNLSEDELYERAAQRTELYALDAEKLIMTGDVSEEELKSVSEKLQKHLSGIRLEYCDTLLGHTSELKESNGVILVEKKNSSRMNEIESDLRIIEGMNIPVIGSILI